MRYHLIELDGRFTAMLDSQTGKLTLRDGTLIRTQRAYPLWVTRASKDALEALANANHRFTTENNPEQP